MIKRVALIAAAAAAVAAVRRRSAGRAEADLWAEATSGPKAVSTPTTR
ncbi:DLW-39 family protein [Trujillonella humicola]